MLVATGHALSTAQLSGLQMVALESFPREIRKDWNSYWLVALSTYFHLVFSWIDEPPMIVGAEAIRSTIQSAPRLL